MSPRSVRALCAVVALLAVGSCDYFKPATPEPPSQPAIVPNYESPDSTLETIALAVEDKGRTNGQTAYVGAFADTTKDGRGFHAFFDPQTVNRMRQIVDIPADWDLPREETFYSKLVTLQTAPYSMQWTVDPTRGEDQIGSDAAILHRTYLIIAIFTSEDRTVAWGDVTLGMVRVSPDRWAIAWWDDHERSDAQLDLGEICLGQRRLEP